MASTTKISVTVPEETRDWLRERYPDATSDSQAVVMAINDARDLEAVLQPASRTLLVDPKGDQDP